MTISRKLKSSSDLVLIVDDEPEILEEMSDWLELLGISNCVSQSVPDAISCLNRNKSIRLVISDIRMPSMDGYDLMRHCSGLGGQRTPIDFIVVTGHLTQQDRTRIAGFGVQRVLAKPADLDELEAMVLEALARTVGSGAETDG
jgi:CheY-like chemotaxis protein